MRKLVPLIALIWLPLVPAVAGGEELRYGFESRVMWNDNIFFSSRDSEIDDFSARLIPRIGMTDRVGELTWEAEYRPSYEYWVDTSNLRGWDHDLSGNLSWNITKRTSLRIEERFQRFRSIHRLNEQEDVDVTAEGIGSRRRFVRNRALASMAHRLSARSTVRVQASHLIWDFSEDTRNDTEMRAATVSYSYLWSDRMRVGMGLSWRDRTVENEAQDVESTTDFYALTFSVDYALDPTWTLSASGGPTWIDAASFDPPTEGTVTLFPQLAIGGRFFFVDATTCPTLPDGRFFFSTQCSPNGTGQFTRSFLILTVPFEGEVPKTESGSLTAFVDFLLTKELPTATLKLAVRRQEDQSSVTSSSSVENIVRATADWRPSPQWRFSFGASYALREQDADQSNLQLAVEPAGFVVVGFPAPWAMADSLGASTLRRDDETTTIRAWVGAHYRLNRRTSLSAQVLWIDEERELTGLRTTESGRLSAWFGFRYDFEPVQMSF